MGCLDEKYRGMDSAQVYNLLRKQPPKGQGGEGGEGGRAVVVQNYKVNSRLTITIGTVRKN